MWGTDKANRVIQIEKNTYSMYKFIFYDVIIHRIERQSFRVPQINS